MPEAPTTPRPADARTVWTRCAVPPLSLETPLAWQPNLANWTERSAHLRWETLTGTPLELNWMWLPSDANESPASVEKRLASAWKRERTAAEKQAKQTGVTIEWKGEPRTLDDYLGTKADGTACEYLWNGQRGCMAVLSVAAEGRRAYVAAALCPTGDDDPIRTAKRVLRSFKLYSAKDSVRFALAGLQVDLPAGYDLLGLRLGEAQVHAEFASPACKVTLARLGMAEQHRAQIDETELQTRLMKVLFDRGEVTDPVSREMTGPPRIFGPGIEKAAGKHGRTADDSVHSHKAGLYLERRRAHIRGGDWILRKLGRRWSGGAAGLAWTCADARALFALCVRKGDADAEAELRALTERMSCHALPDQHPVDWRPFVYAEAGLKSDDDAQGEPIPAKKEKLSAVDLRRKQLRFRVRTRDEVRFEPSLKDETASLVYPVQGGSGMFVTLLRGGRPAEVFHRRLALDPIGRKVWEKLAHGPTVAQVLAELCAELGVHPVVMFTKLLLYLKMLGERHLVETATPEAADGGSEQAETAASTQKESA
ncbi:MAG: PqqD family protein [Planctomycetes bacterium]|nr:PqqD family protein [Planctomycetota bacterium]